MREDAPTYWRDGEELGQIYGDAGVGMDNRVIVYGEGVNAYVTYFTLRLLGYEDVAVYPGGWDEWSAYPDLPRGSG